MSNWQGTDLTQEEFFAQQDKIEVEISPPEPRLVPLKDFNSIPQLHPTLKRNINAAGYKIPTPVQRHGIPLFLLGKDVMACAQTGSGKTAFYLLAPLNGLLQKRRQQRPSQPAAPLVLIMGPTRELCVQIFEEAQKFGEGSSSAVISAVVYGGTEYKESTKQLSEGVDLLVATPGRLQDLVQRNACVLWSVKTLILDEADRMLDMGFEPAIRNIVLKSKMNRNRQTVMTSATFPEEVQHLAQDFMRDYSFMAVGRVGGAGSTIKQKLEWVEDEDKNDFLYGLLLHAATLGLVLIFVNTKIAATEVERFVAGSGFSSVSIHGDKLQSEREEALEAFKSKEVSILIATDVAARGLDIPDVALVIQYDLATSVDDYVHRIGRTGRIGKTGISVGLVNNRAKGNAAELLTILEESGNKPPAFLVGMAISNGTYQNRLSNNQSTYGGQDVRKSTKGGFSSAEEKAKARRFEGFNKDAYGEGALSTVGPKAEGSYFGASKGKGKGKSKGKNDRSGPYGKSK